jgi:hypothetical protein
VRIWQPRDLEALRVRLGNTLLATWAEDDILHVLWRGQAGEVDLAAGIQPRLWPVQGAEDLWEASVRIRRLAEAVITIAVLPRRADDDRAARSRTSWCGAGHSTRPANRRLPCRRDHRTCAGQHRAWRTARRDRLPPARAAGAAARCVLADGGAARSFAGTLEPAVLTGAVPPVLLVGVHNAVDPATLGPDLRAREYVPGRDQ